MTALLHRPDPDRLAHLEEAARVLALPVEASGLHWHPFGVYAVPLARRVEGNEVWVRRLHVWHPAGTPVGERSIYGVHTHSGQAQSHVVVGALQHHLYAFEPDEGGVWREASRAGERRASLVWHAEGRTDAGVTHTLPAHHPHGVGKAPGLAISLFEQREEGRGVPFTTWQRQDGPAEALVLRAPVAPAVVRREAFAALEALRFALGVV